MALIFGLAGIYAGIWFQTQAPESAPELVISPSADPQFADALPDFILPDPEGTPHNIQEWAGRPLLINFWATWCRPCIREMPMLQTLHTERRDDPLEIIGIAVDRMTDVTAFLAEAGITYPILVGQGDAMEAAGSFGPEFVGLPFTLFVAPSGELLSYHSGEIHPQELRAILAITDQVTAGTLSPEKARTRLE